MFKLEMKTSNAAFEDNEEFEVAEILKNVVPMLEDGMRSGTLRDVNGNEVGEWSLS